MYLSIKSNKNKEKNYAENAKPNNNSDDSDFEHYSSSFEEAIENDTNNAAIRSNEIDEPKTLHIIENIDYWLTNSWTEDFIEIGKIQLPNEIKKSKVTSEKDIK